MHNKILKFLVFIVLFFSTIERVNASELVKNAVKDVYYVRRGGEEKYFSAPFSEYSIDGFTTYCIEPGTRITSQQYIKKDGLIDSPFDATLTNKLELIGYYGYDYPTHKTVRYRMATQALIWETISSDFIVDFWTKQYGYGDAIDVSKEKKEIMDLVNNHYSLPNIPNEVNTSAGKTVELNDTNNLLDQFEVTDNGGTDAVIEGNVLYINNIKSGNTTITLTKKRYTNTVSNLFFGENTKTQIMAYFGLSTPIQFNIKIKATSGKLVVEKTDNETQFKPQGDAELKGAIFHLFKENGEFVEEIIIDDDLVVNSNLELDIGKYYLQEIKPGTGYELNPTQYYFEVTEDSLDKKITISNKVIKAELQIYKVFDNNLSGVMQGESNIKFAIYLKSTNELKYTITTDNNGFASITLPYGTYIIKQINTTNGYEKAGDFEIVVNENSENIIKKVVNDKKILYNVKINKIDNETKKLIKLDGIKFKLKNLDTNEYICQNTNCTFETLNGSFTIKNLGFGNYELEEVENQIILGYAWNSKALQFTIDNNSALKDKDGTKILEFNFSNTPIKGQINIIKYGEMIYYRDNTIDYKYELLNNVEYTLFAAENIYYNGELKYQKDTIIGVYKTQNGKIVINNLYLGKYYLKETKTLENYLLDDKIYSVNLINDNQYDLTIKKEYKFKNVLKKGNITILKKDKDTNIPLENVLIEIHDKKNDKIIYKGKTDKNGNISIKNIYYGEFYILELETKKGYILLSQPISFEINSDSTLTIEIENEKIKGSLRFIKKDKETLERLSNVAIQILDENEKIVYDGLTNENGEIVVQNLPYGKYYLIEKKALDGYILYNGRLEFSINNNNEIIELEMLNEKEPIVETFIVPKTFANNKYIYLILFFSNIIVGLYFIHYAKKNKC